MEVKCIKHKGTQSLIEGKIYIAERLTSRGDIKIKGFKNPFSVDRFRDIDGNVIIVPGKTVNFNMDSFKDNYAINNGDKVLCVNPNLKRIKYGEIYTAHKVTKDEYIYTREVELKGITGKYYPWGNLIKIPKNISREMILNEFLNDDKNNYLDFHLKGFDKYAKKAMILEYISKAMMYLMETKIKDTSVREVFNRMVDDNNFISKEDFDSVKF